MKQSATYFIILLTIFTLTAKPINAVSVISAQQAGVDVSLIAPDTSYTSQEQIIVLPIFPPTDDFNQFPTDWYKGLYYYLIGSAVRPGFTDMPFHYIVTEEGKLFQGNQGRDERKIVIEGASEDAVVVAYLAGKGEVEFDSRAVTALEELLLDISNRNAINPSKVKVSGISFLSNSVTETVSMKSAQIFGLWNNSLTTIINRISSKYSPINKEYTLQVVSVNGPVDQVKTGDLVQFTVRLKNTGNFGLYGATNASVLLTKSDGSKSIFYDPASWSTTSQVLVVKDNESLLPGEEKDFTLQTKMPIDFGEKSEDFILKTVSGLNIKDVVIKLAANIARPEGTIVQVKQTETGFLRVRESPSGAANEIARVSPGERYFQTEDAGNGWVRITLTDGRQGWVANQFLTYL